jgi:hypothetical protein
MSESNSKEMYQPFIVDINKTEVSSNQNNNMFTESSPD